MLGSTGFDEDALFTFAGGEQVLNFGRVTTTGTLAGDLLLGGGGEFVLIENGAGKISIADFSAAGGDVVDVSAFFSSFEDLTDRSRQSNGDVVIDLDHNDRLLLVNVQLTELNGGDFVFS